MGSKPTVVTWFIVFCAVMCVMNLFLIGLGILMPRMADLAPQEDMAEAKITGPIYIIGGLIFLILYALGIFLKPSPGVWIYDIVLIALGMLSCCTLPFAIALLIFWIKPETQAYFGRGQAPPAPAQGQS